MQNNYQANLQNAYDFIVSSQNSDGGWGYRRDGMSYVEPTCFALIALFSPLGAGGQDVPATRYNAVLRGLVYLRSQQHPDGGWGTHKEDKISNWMTYPMVWILNLVLKIPELASYYGKPEDVELRDKGRAWLVSKGQEGATSPDLADQVRKLFKIESSFLGWTWGSGESGWVIPTSFAMLALLVEDPAVIRESREIMNGKNYLRDRACPDGGWNVGNPWMLGKKLPPAMDTTVFALVAWRLAASASDFGENSRVITAGRAFLEENIEKSNSDHTVALASWALSLYAEPAELEKYRQNLVNGYRERTFKVAGKDYTMKTVKGQSKDTGGWANSAYTTAIATFVLNDSRYYLGL